MQTAEVVAQCQRTNLVVQGTKVKISHDPDDPQTQCVFRINRFPDGVAWILKPKLCCGSFIEDHIPFTTGLFEGIEVSPCKKCNRQIPEIVIVDLKIVHGQRCVVLAALIVVRATIPGAEPVRYSTHPFYAGKTSYF